MQGEIEVELVPWCPKGMLASPGLIAVWVKPGAITESEWWEALVDRVTVLAEKAGPEQTLQACRALDTPMAQPDWAGECLVRENWNLRSFINCSVIDESPFPAVAEFEESAQSALEEVEDLDDWVSLAAAFVSGHDLL